MIERERSLHCAASSSSTRSSAGRTCFRCCECWPIVGRAFGVSDTTVRRYLHQLVSTFALRLLPPWHENISKRQVRAPRTFVSDPGLLHMLLGLESAADVLGHAKVGASWEGFVIEQVIRQLQARPEECFFWRGAHGCRTRPVRGSRPAATRLRDQAHDLAHDDAIHPYRAHGLEARLTHDRSRRWDQLSPRTARARRGARVTPQ